MIAHHVSAGEIYHLRQALPLSIAELWPSLERSEEAESKRKRSKRTSSRF